MLSVLFHCHLAEVCQKIFVPLFLARITTTNLINRLKQHYCTWFQFPQDIGIIKKIFGVFEQTPPPQMLTKVKSLVRKCNAYKYVYNCITQK